MFSKIQAVVMTLLGIKAFAKDESGKFVLSAEERKKLVSEYGEKFTVKFEGQLAELKEEPPADPEGVRSEVHAEAAPQVEALQDQLAESQKQNHNLREMIAAMSEKPETAPAAEGIRSFVEKKQKETSERSFKVDMSASHYVAAGQFSKTGVMGAGASTTIDVVDLKKEFGTYLNNGTKMDLYTQIFQGFETAKHMTTKLAVTEYRASRGLINSVVQQFSPKWTPKGSIQFTPLVIKNRHHKINYSIIPADVIDSWMMYLYDEGVSPDKMPITRYIMQEYLLPKILEDIELRMIAKGKYKENATDNLKEGEPGVPAEDGMDGFETILVQAKKEAGRLGMQFFSKTIDWKSASDQEVLDFISNFVAFVAPVYRKKSMPVFCSPEVYTRYKIAYKKIWGEGSGTTDPKFGSDRIDYSNSILTPLDSMYASPILFTTPKENFIKLRSKNEVPNIVNDVQKINYEVRIFGEFWLGCGFGIGEAVTAYVPDGYDPYATISACYGDSADWKGANTVIGNGGGAGDEGEGDGDSL